LELMSRLLGFLFRGLLRWDCTHHYPASRRNNVDIRVVGIAPAIRDFLNLCWEKGLSENVANSVNCYWDQSNKMKPKGDKKVVSGEELNAKNAKI
jgi:hypothetical protein